MRKYLKGTIVVLFIIVALFVGAGSIRNKLTYLEYQYINEIPYGVDNGYVEVTQNGQKLIQEFISPYELLDSVEIRVQLQEHDNNSRWRLELKQKDATSCLMSEIVGAGGNTGYLVVDFPDVIETTPGEVYELHIEAIHVTEDTGLAFLINGQDNLKVFSGEGKTYEGALSLKVYGTDKDNWWLGFYFMMTTITLLVGIYAYRVRAAGQKLTDSRIFSAFLVVLVTFLLLLPYVSQGCFGDENDNIQGGILIAKGGVLYKDYVTQHTPFLYYLCALFAKLGAESIQQFRLCWYLFTAMIWGFIYYRHVEKFGKKRMWILPILNILLVASLHDQGMMIMSDNVQGLCMVMLLFEFAQYIMDKKLDYKRAIIVSLSSVISVGATFVSIYPIFVLFIGLLMYEYDFWKKRVSVEKNREASVCGIVLSRYGIMLLSTLILVGGSALHFYVNGALGRAYDMAYRFNVEVYPEYTGGIGNNKLQPFFSGVSGFFEALASTMNNLLGNNTNVQGNLRLCLLLLLVGVLIKMLINRKILQAVLLFLFVCVNATRGGLGFHSIPFWYIVLAMIIIYAEISVEKRGQSSMCFVILGSLLVYFSAPYMTEASENIFKEQEPISELQQRVIALTEEGEGILVDTGVCDPIYLYARGRYPVNRNQFFLPWYLDWYEQELIEDMQIYEPRIVLYNPDMEVWGETGFGYAFDKAIEENYIRFSYNPDDGWMYSFWLKK